MLPPNIHMILHGTQGISYLHEYNGIAYVVYPDSSMLSLPGYDPVDSTVAKSVINSILAKFKEPM